MRAAGAVRRKTADRISLVAGNLTGIFEKNASPEPWQAAKHPAIRVVWDRIPGRSGSANSAYPNSDFRDQNSEFQGAARQPAAPDGT
jgi:hypothetical protein